jgi:hypothetical protein
MVHLNVSKRKSPSILLGEYIREKGVQHGKTYVIELTFRHQLVLSEDGNVYLQMEGTQYLMSERTAQQWCVAFGVLKPESSALWGALLLHFVGMVVALTGPEQLAIPGLLTAIASVLWAVREADRSPRKPRGL